MTQEKMKLEFLLNPMAEEASLESTPASLPATETVAENMEGNTETDSASAGEQVMGSQSQAGQPLGLRQPRRSGRSSTHRRKFGCTICPTRFFKAEHRNRHVALVHFGERPYPCNVCNLGFGTYQNQQSHFRTRKHSVRVSRVNVEAARNEGQTEHRMEVGARIATGGEGTSRLENVPNVGVDAADEVGVDVMVSVGGTVGVRGTAGFATEVGTSMTDRADAAVGHCPSFRGGTTDVLGANVEDGGTAGVGPPVVVDPIVGVGEEEGSESMRRQLRSQSN